MWYLYPVIMLVVLALACKLPHPEPLPEVPELEHLESQDLVDEQPAADATFMPISDEAEAPAQAAEEEPIGERVLVRHVLIAYKGAAKADAVLRRNEQEARRLAEEIRKRAVAGEDFATLAREHSEGPSAKDGGRLPPFSHGAMAEAFEEAAFALEDNEISEVVETPFGFHIIKREPLIERRIAHLMVQWEGATGADVTRSKQEAEQRIHQAKAELEAGTPFDEVARTYSDGPTARLGGQLGIIQKGQMAPQFDEAAFALDIGEVSDIVESPFGYHILRRLD